MKLAKDKWLHLLVSAILTVIFAVNLSWVAACAIVFALGLLKELYDKFNHKPFSIDDIFADLEGILIGSGVYIVFALLFKLFKVPGW